MRFEGNWEAVEIEGPYSFDAGTLILKVKKVPVNVFMDLQAKTEARTEVTLREGVTAVHRDLLAVEGQFSQVLTSDVTLTYGTIIFAGVSPGNALASSFSLTISGTARAVVANDVKVRDYAQTLLKNLTVLNSVELGRVSSILAETLEPKEFNVMLHFSWEEGVPSFFEGTDILPKSLELIYDGDDSSVVIYPNSSLVVRVFSTPSQCDTWKSRVSFSSSGFDVECSEGTLLIVPSDKSLPVGPIVGGVIGALVLIAIIVVVVVLFVWKRKKDSTTVDDMSDRSSSEHQD